MAVAPELRPSTRTTVDCLKAFKKAQETRAAIMNEFAGAIELNLKEATAIPSEEETAPEPQEEEGEEHVHGRCAHEAIQPLTAEQVEQVMRVALDGIIEMRVEIETIVLELQHSAEREAAAMARTLEKVEELERERMATILQRDQMLRIRVVSPEVDTDAAVKQLEERRDTLTDEINEELAEVSATIADLSLAAEV